MDWGGLKESFSCLVLETQKASNGWHHRSTSRINLRLQARSDRGTALYQRGRPQIEDVESESPPLVGLCQANTDVHLQPQTGCFRPSSVKETDFGFISDRCSVPLEESWAPLKSKTSITSFPHSAACLAGKCLPKSESGNSTLKHRTA